MRSRLCLYAQVGRLAPVANLARLLSGCSVSSFTPPGTGNIHVWVCDSSNQTSFVSPPRGCDSTTAGFWWNSAMKRSPLSWRTAPKSMAPSQVSKAVLPVAGGRSKARCFTTCTGQVLSYFCKHVPVFKNSGELDSRLQLFAWPQFHVFCSVNHMSHFKFTCRFIAPQCVWCGLCSLLGLLLLSSLCATCEDSVIWTPNFWSYSEWKSFEALSFYLHRLKFIFLLLNTTIQQTESKGCCCLSLSSLTLRACLI